MRLSKPSQLFLGGLIVAGLIYGAGQLIGFKTESGVIDHDAKAKLSALEEECRTKGDVYDAAYYDFMVNIEHKTDPQIREALAQIHLSSACAEWVRLLDQTRSSKDKAKIRSSEQTGVWSQYVEQWTLPTAAVVLGFAALPWLWYFLLRRIRELRDAILGK